jgi:hypothetical protein
MTMKKLAIVLFVAAAALSACGGKSKNAGTMGSGSASGSDMGSSMGGSGYGGGSGSSMGSGSASGSASGGM